MTIDAATPLTFDIGRVISRLAGTIGRNFALLLGLAVLLVGLPGAMLAFAQLSMMSGMLSPVGPGDPFADVLAPVRVGLWVAGVLIGVVGNAALQGAVIHASVSDLSGRRATFGECLATGLRFFLPLFCIGLIVAVCCFFGYLLIIVPGVLLGLAWCMAAPAEVVERTGIFASLSRSAELTRNHRAAIFGLVVIFFVVVLVVQTVIGAVDAVAFGLGGGLVLDFSPGSPGLNHYVVAQSVAGVIVKVLVSSLAAAGLASIYFELRHTKEGVGVDELAAVFD